VHRIESSDRIRTSVATLATLIRWGCRHEVSLDTKLVSGMTNTNAKPATQPDPTYLALLNLIQALSYISSSLAPAKIQQQILSRNKQHQVFQHGKSPECRKRTNTRRTDQANTDSNPSQTYHHLLYLLISVAFAMHALTLYWWRTSFPYLEHSLIHSFITFAQVHLAYRCGLPLVAIERALFAMFVPFSASMRYYRP